MGAIAGVLSVAGYFAVVLPFLPGPVSRIIFFAIPLAGILFVVGASRVLSLYGPTVAVQVATLFGIIGFSVMNLMAVVQNSIHLLISRHTPAAMSRDEIEWVRRGVDSVQLGLDVSFDIFVLVSVILFAFAMRKHPRFGPVFAISGSLAAAATLVLNLTSFPMPPKPDLGPVVAVWLLAVALRMLFSGDYVKKLQRIQREA